MVIIFRRLEGVDKMHIGSREYSLAVEYTVPTIFTAFMS